MTIKKGDDEVLSATLGGTNNTELVLTNKEVATGKVNKIKLTGDFQKFKFKDISHILSDINPSD